MRTKSTKYAEFNNKIINHLILFLLLFISNIAAQCFAPNPQNPRELIPVACNLVKNEPQENLKFKDSTSNNSSSSNNMFDITLNCTVSTDLCSKVQKAFDTAGSIISSYLLLNTRIVLSASFESFCDLYSSCSENGILGFASPARWILMEDDDNIQRLYPQSLVKQFELSTHPEYSKNDIIASFNSDVSYWFAEDSTPINETQFDFLYVMLHELHHGLGFSSAWDEYFTGYVTPLLANDPIKEIDAEDDLVYNNTSYSSFKFYECAFDKYVILMENGQKASEITEKLNTYFTENNNANKKKNFEISFPTCLCCPIILA
ncbi:hypothetical protein Glove_74g268 [Diversispora epigaea]|uniref:Sequence orphan n=1 Tax=Diversispora epigaea TaxID=1348612 RepID=A0A397JBP9_9GLOM|nr:hypothetical protein Glove_74g268 [Diversispora epigaea]